MIVKRIGVLGGIGPEATSEFYGRLIDRLQERGLIRTNRDFPQIIINSIPAPELIRKEISDEELQPYIDGLKELDGFGVDLIVMVCNTIHLYYDRLQKNINTPILDLKAEMRDMLESEGIRSTFVIGTPNTIRQGLYRFKGIRHLEPDEEELKQLVSSIFDFNKGVEKQAQVQTVRRICERHLAEGAQAVILGCTEFAVMLGEEDIPKIDTIDVLVDAVIRIFSSG